MSAEYREYECCFSNHPNTCYLLFKQFYNISIMLNNNVNVIFFHFAVR
jgi:hypothetical protein